MARRTGSLGYPCCLSDSAQLLVGVLIPLTNELNVIIHTIHETYIEERQKVLYYNTLKYTPFQKCSCMEGRM